MRQFVFDFFEDILGDKCSFSKTIEAENTERATKEAYEIAIETNTFYSLREELKDAR